MSEYLDEVLRKVSIRSAAFQMYIAGYNQRVDDEESEPVTIREALISRVHNKHHKRYWSEVDRESYVCPMCSDPRRRDLEVHHINRDWMDGRMVNLVAICHICHNRVHDILHRTKRLKKWKNDFKELRGEIR